MHKYRTPGFSQRHPLLFGLLLLGCLAVVLFVVLALFKKQGSGTGSFPGAQQRLGVVRVEGVISDAEELVSWMYALRMNARVPGVLVRVNSPGGGVAPSQELYHAVRQLAKVKPVVVSMGSTAASGGYYLSAPANLIVANPSTLTGSIGVIMQLANVKDLLEKLGIKPVDLSTGEFKGAGSSFRDLTEPEHAYFMALINDMHEQFVTDIASGRGMDTEEVRKLADGRAFTGNQALRMGLVDNLGTMEDAIIALKELCGISGEISLLEQPEKKENWLRSLLSEAHINITITGDIPALSGGIQSTPQTRTTPLIH